MKINARLEYKLEDFWIGVFWKSSKEGTDIYICFIPCFPLHIMVYR